MPADFGYINARIHGLRAKLLGPEFYTEALNATDLKALSAALAQSVYMREMEEAQARYEGIRVIDDAVARNFFNTARSILNFSDGSAGRLISALLLRYDLNNLKTIARARHAGRDAADIQAGLLPAGELKHSVLETIAAAPDMAAAAQLVAVSPTPLRSAFVRAASRYGSDSDLYALELELDRAYYKILLETAKKEGATQRFIRYIKREIDATNLRTALSLRGTGGSGENLFVSGGLEFTRAMMDAIINDSSHSAFQMLSGTSFAALAETKTLSEAEAVIRSVMDENAKGLAADSMNIGLAAHYLRQKEAESAKLRLLARGKFYGVPREALAKELGDA